MSAKRQDQPQPNHKRYKFYDFHRTSKKFQFGFAPRKIKYTEARKRNDSLIHSLLEAGLSFREVARIARCSHGSVSASKKELLAKKAKLEQEKILELQNQMKQNSSESTIETMKSMNVSEDVVKQVQQKIESEARDKVQSVMGHAGYETYD